MSVVQTYPRKLFYKINEVADIVGVEAYVLRYWETKFPMLKPERRSNDERRYRQKDVELLLRIRHLLYEEKFTIAGAVDRIKKDPSGGLDLNAETVALADGNDEGGDGADQSDLFDAATAERLSAARRELTAIREELRGLLDAGA